MANCKVLDFIFLEKPILRERTPLHGMSKEKLKSITRLPYVLTKNCPFSAIIEVDGQEIEFRGVMPKGFCTNLADIKWLFQPITFDNDSPFIKDASTIHDYLLDRRVQLYEHWGLKKLGVTPSNFRKITSDIFNIVLKQSAVSDIKANIMSSAVDIWQTILFKEWSKCGK